MLCAEQLCGELECLATPLEDDDRIELRLKLSQCRGFLGELQESFNSGTLSISSAVVRANFRQLIMALLWAVFRARHIIDRKMFLRLVSIESGFTCLLAMRP